MAGFEWSPAAPFVPTQPGENGWCVRDAFCELFEWEIGSDEWSRFVEGPQGPDMLRLAAHLGLTVFEIPRDWNQLSVRCAHPGVAVLYFYAYQMSHVVYVHDVRWLMHHWSTPDGLPSQKTAERRLWSYGWPLGTQHVERGPVLGAVIVDERQPPHV